MLHCDWLEGGIRRVPGNSRPLQAVCKLVEKDIFSSLVLEPSNLQFCFVSGIRFLEFLSQSVTFLSCIQ